ncbi:hypothetical protein V5N11_008260 [Cardamine amara subsp. amara]|uniref:Retrotransposon gag domain-containing protein n=1 Tax=Cardamine amara subsp. amara TaxID=228776 RepID=A0ABD1BSR2_CARAN
MTERVTRSKRSGRLITLTNRELRDLERANRQQRLNPIIMDNQDEENLAAGNEQGNENVAAELQRLQQQMTQMQQRQRRQEQQREQQRAIGDMDNPHAFYRNRAAIVPPAVERQDFEIKPQMISLVKQHLFHGLPAEIPMDHIENFEEICSTTRSNGVSPDFLKCKLFPFSLADKASRWLKSLPPGSITNWDQCRSAFLDHFYTKTKTAALRNKLSAFQQHSGEPFCEAWERFKEYRRECPHHGFTDENLLGIFYDGVDWDYRNALNAASNGDFMTKTKEGAYELIENLAASSNSKSQEYDRSKKTSNMDNQKIDELTAKVNLLLKGNQRTVHFVDENGEPLYQEDDVDQQEVSYVNGQGFVQNRSFNQNYRNHPNLSYRSTNVENPMDQVYPQQSGNQNQQPSNVSFQKDFSQGFQGKQFVPYQAQNRFQGGNQQGQQFTNFQASTSSGNNSQDELKDMMKQLMLNQQKTANEINLKVDTMYSDLNSKYEAVCIHLKQVDTQTAQNAEAIKRQKGILPARSEQNPKNTQGAGPSHAQVNFIEDEAPPQEKQLESMMKKILEGQARSASLVNDRLDALDWKIANLSCEIQQEITSRMQFLSTSESSVSSRSDKSKQTANAKKKKSSSMPPQIGISSSTRQVPVSVSQISLKTVGSVGSSSCKLLPKLEDPGKFVVPCSVLGTEFKDSICDSGSTVNIMSLDIVRSLKLVDSIEPSKMTLRFSDATVKTSKGCIMDLQVRVGDCLMHVDFQVVEMSQGSYMPLILGRTFLATAGAVVDLPNKRVCLSKVNTAVFYDAVPVCIWSPSGSYVTIENCKLEDTFTPKSGGELSSSKLILIPKKIVDDAIEYKLKSNGSTRPFSRVRALVTPELKAKGHDAENDMMSKVLILDLNPTPPDPGPSRDHRSHA